MTGTTQVSTCTEMTTFVFALDKDLDAVCQSYRPVDRTRFVFIAAELLTQLGKVHNGACNDFLARWSNTPTDQAVQSVSLLCSISGIDIDYRMLDADRFMFRTVTRVTA